MANGRDRELASMIKEACYGCCCEYEFEVAYLADDWPSSHALKLESSLDGDWLTPPSNISIGDFRTLKLVCQAQRKICYLSLKLCLGKNCKHHLFKRRV